MQNICISIIIIYIIFKFFLYTSSFYVYNYNICNLYFLTKISDILSFLRRLFFFNDIIIWIFEFKHKLYYRMIFLNFRDDLCKYYIVQYVGIVSCNIHNAFERTSYTYASLCYIIFCQWNYIFLYFMLRFFICYHIWITIYNMYGNDNWTLYLSYMRAI